MLEAPAYAFGPFCLIPARRLLLRGGEPVPLTPRAFDTLLTLVERRDRVVSKEELLHHVWEGTIVEESNLTQQVFLLRKALEDTSDGECYIATVPRRGYRFVHDVELATSSPLAKPQAPTRPIRWQRVTAVVAVLMVLAAGLLLVLARRGPPSIVSFSLEQLTNAPGIESFPSVSPDGREFVYASGPLDHFGESDLYRRDVGLDRDLPLTPDSPGTDTQPAFSHDGGRIAFCSLRNDAAEDGGIYVMARDGSGVRPLSPEGYNPAWSPDDSEIVYATVHTMASPFANAGDRSALRVVNVTTGARRTIRDRAAAQPHWSPHGYRIAYWASGAISTCRPDGSDVQEVVPGGRGADSYSWNPVWSPDGNFLYFSSNRNGVMHLWRARMDERSGRAIEAPEPAPAPMPSTYVAHPSFDRAGRLLFATMPPSAAIERVPFDVSSGEVRGARTPLTPQTSVWVYPEASPDGKRLAFHTLHNDATVGSIYVSDADGSSIRPLTPEKGAGDRVPRWSPDGRQIAFYSVRGGKWSNIWLVDADGSNMRQVTRSSASHVHFPSWAPDGRIAATEAPGGRSFVFDPDQPWDSATSVTALPPLGPGIEFVPWSWSPDGTQLAGYGRPRRAKGVVVLSLASGRYSRLTTRGSTPVWLPDGQRLVYAVDDRLMLLEIRTGKSRELLNTAPGTLEIAAGGGFSISTATGHIYLSPSLRYPADIWLAAPDARR